jgi:hypothetical protein
MIPTTMSPHFRLIYGLENAESEISSVIKMLENIPIRFISIERREYDKS